MMTSCAPKKEIAYKIPLDLLVSNTLAPDVVEKKLRDMNTEGGGFHDPSHVGQGPWLSCAEQQQG